MEKFKTKWDITGVVAEIGDHDQYVIRVDGSGRMTLRNRRFLRKITPFSMTKHFRTSDPPVDQTNSSPNQPPQAAEPPAPLGQELEPEAGLQEPAQTEAALKD